MNTMKRIFGLLCVLFALIGLGACNDVAMNVEKELTVEQKIQGGWIVARQTTVIKMGDTIIKQDDEEIEMGSSALISFGAGNQLFVCQMTEENGLPVVGEKVCQCQWSVVDDSRLKISNLEGDESFGEYEAILSMGEVTIKSISENQLVLEGSTEQEIVGQKVEMRMTVYLNRDSIRV